MPCVCVSKKTKDKTNKKTNIWSTCSLFLPFCLYLSLQVRIIAAKSFVNFPSSSEPWPGKNSSVSDVQNKVDTQASTNQNRLLRGSCPIRMEVNHEVFHEQMVMNRSFCSWGFMLRNLSDEVLTDPAFL